MYAMLGAINEAVLHATTPQELYQRVCDAAMIGDRFLAVAVGLPDSTTARIEFAAVAGKGAYRMRNAGISVNAESREGQGLVGTAFRTLTSCISNDFLADQRTRHWHKIAESSGIVAAAAIPLIHAGHAIGVLLLYSAHKNSFDAETMQLLERMAGNISFGLNNFEREAERERAEAALRASEERYRTVLEGIEDLYYENDLAGNLICHNSAMSRMFGYSDAELENLSYRNYIAPEDLNKVFATFNKVYRTGAPTLSEDWNALCKDGSRIRVEGSVHLIRNSTGEPTGFRGIMRDVTARRKMEQSLRHSEEKYRGILESIDDAYYEVDLRGKQRMHNPAFYRMVGYSAEEIERMHYLEYQTPEMAKVVSDAFKEVFATGVSKHSTYWEHIHKDGTVVQVEGSIQLARDADGQPNGFRGIMRDITKRRREERLLQLEHKITLGLSEAPSIRRAAEMILRHICESEKWDFGGYWVEGEEPDTLRLDLGWANAGAPAPALAFYEEMVGKLTVGNGSYMKDTWDSREPAWIADVRVDDKFKSRGESYFLAHAEQPAAFSVPVVSEGKVVSLLAFTNSSIREPDERLLQAVRVIGSQFGQYLQRKKAERIVRESEERFRALTNLSSDWYWEQDAEFRFTRMESRHENKVEIEELLQGRRAWDAGFEIQHEGGWDAYRDLLASHESYRDVIMYRILDDGRPYYISVSGEPIFNKAGRLVGYRGVAREITDQKIAEERIQYLATHDGLTGLPNRVLFSHLLNGALTTAQRYQRSFAVLFIDLDRFKFINDTLGHEAGDMLLKEITARFKGVLRASDVIARLGGDEFVVLVQEMNDRIPAEAVARKLLDATIQPVTLFGQECRVTASIGIAMYPADGKDEKSLMKNADIAMYFAKEEGKNNSQFYSPEIKTQSLERLALEAHLRHAMERNEFMLHYQAKLDLKTREINGVEALLRWNNLELGSVSPIQFIPVAEETGMIVSIGKWVLQTACAQNVAWQRQGLPTISMAVNLSVRQFADPNLLKDIAEVLQQTGMDPHLLELEITEGMVVHNPAHAIKLLTAIKKMGIRLAIDDFGTGYSSLGQLKHFPIDTLKVDRSFIRDIATNNGDKAITEAIIAMGKTLSLRVVAEGVETLEQENILRDNACDEVQGYYFSRPIAADEFATFFSNHVGGLPSIRD